MAINEKDNASVNTPDTIATSFSPTIPSDMSSTANGSNTSTEVVNSIKENQMQVEMLKVLKAMQEELNKLKRGTNTSSSTKKGRKTPDNASFSRNTTDKYCWTHGGCAHESANCNAKAPGHKDNATFENKMGGSKAFCT